MNLSKIIDYVVAKIKILQQQQIYNYKNFKIKYILEENESNELVVIFSSCTRVGIKARYNYMNTLRNQKYNKLFILDDYGDDGRGVYYLGQNKDFSLADGVSELIKKVESERKTKESIYVGSSKGGYAAMYFGFKDKSDYIISGAPQFNLGDFVNDEGGYHIMKYLCGNIKPESVVFLNNILKDVINKVQYEQYPKIFLHYSKEEFTYKEHILDLKNNLDEKGIKYEEDIGTYQEHGEISKFFPGFIIGSLRKINFPIVANIRKR